MIVKGNSIAIDTGVLLELLSKTELGIKFENSIIKAPNIKKFYISPFVETELLYIRCRKTNFKQAKQNIKDFLHPFIMIEESEIRYKAAELKCKYSISLADCYILAVGIKKTIPVFMKREEEIEKIISPLEKEVIIYFIDDI